MRVPNISARQQPQVHGDPGEVGDLVGRAQGEDGQTVAVHPGRNRASSTGLVHTGPQGNFFLIEVKISGTHCSHVF